VPTGFAPEAFLSHDQHDLRKVSRRQRVTFRSRATVPTVATDRGAGGPVAPNIPVVCLRNVRVAAVVAESLNRLGAGVDLTSTPSTAGKIAMEVTTVNTGIRSGMIRNLRRIAIGVLASSAPLSIQVSLAQSPNVVIPQRRAPQAFLVEAADPVPIVAHPPIIGPPSALPSAIAFPISDENLRASLRGVVLQSMQLTKDGVALAAKGATYSARVKFLTALQLIADALDARHNTQYHSRALMAGVIALREADDFGHSGSASEGTADPTSLAASHVTPVLKEGRAQSATRLQALQLYYSYATTQFTAAAGGIPEASNAIYYLGRLQPFLGGSIDRNPPLAQPKALALEQAALAIDPRNYRAANELGVLLARCGQLEPARKALLYSASIERRPEIFQNLAYVYREMGDRSDAGSMLTLASEEQRQQTGRPGSTGVPPLVYVVDHKTFAGDTPINEAAGPMQTPPPAPGSESTTATPQGSTNYQGAASSPPTYAAPPAAPLAPQEFLAPLAWDVFAQGEYIGPARTAHVPEYYLRVDDQLSFVFRMNGKPMSTPYRLNVGDVIRITSLTMPTLQLDTPVQPDGTIIVPQIGPVTAAGKSIEVLRGELNQKYTSILREPAISVVPITINKTAGELLTAVTNRTQVNAGQSFSARVSPNGTVQLPALGSVPAQGLTLTELRSEVEARYAEIVPGVEVTPVLLEHAPRSVYVLGEVAKPGKFALDAPTTVIQAIAMAGSWNIGGNLREVIVFRRDDCWRLMATRVCVRPALYNSRKLEADDIWLRDNDIVIVPKCPLQVFDDYAQLIFTKGIYAVVPFQGANFTFVRDLSTSAVVIP
jgi:polysaccharide export outer membrane protein